MAENVAPPGQDVTQAVAAEQSAAAASAETKQKTGMFSDLTVDVRRFDNQLKAIQIRIDFISGI